MKEEEQGDWNPFCPGGETAPSSFAIGFDYRVESPTYGDGANATTAVYPLATAAGSGGGPADYRNASDFTSDPTSPTTPTNPTNPDLPASTLGGAVGSHGDAVKMDSAGYAIPQDVLPSPLDNFGYAVADAGSASDDGSGSEAAPPPPRRSNPPGGKGAASRATQSVFITGKGPSLSANRVRASTTAALPFPGSTPGSSRGGGGSRAGDGGDGDGDGGGGGGSRPARPARPTPPSGLATADQRERAAAASGGAAISSPVVRRGRSVEMQAGPPA